MKDESKKVHPHHGHRQRMTKNFMSSVQTPLTEVQFVEMLLFYCIPRSDTNPIAHDLLKRFGSIEGILSAADEEEIAKIREMGKISAKKLKKIAEFVERYNNLIRKETFENKLSHRKLCEIVSLNIRDILHDVSDSLCFLLLCISKNEKVLYKHSFKAGIADYIFPAIAAYSGTEDVIWILCVMEQVSEQNPNTKLELDALKKSPAVNRLSAIAYVSSSMKIRFEII